MIRPKILDSTIQVHIYWSTGATLIIRIDWVGMFSFIGCFDPSPLPSPGTTFQVETIERNKSAVDLLQTWKFLQIDFCKKRENQKIAQTISRLSILGQTMSSKICKSMSLSENVLHLNPLVCHSFPTKKKKQKHKNGAKKCEIPFHGKLNSHGPTISTIYPLVIKHD